MRRPILVVSLFGAACGGGGEETDDTETTSDASSTGDDGQQTTIPLPGDSTTTDDPSSGGTIDGSGDGPGTSDGSAGTTGDASTTAGEEAEDTSSSSGGASSSDSGDGTFVVSWCRLQYPASIELVVDQVFTVYGRLYAEGLTDQSTVNDLDPMLVAEAGYGADGSDPARDAWTWIAATSNIGWDGSAPRANEPNNDEYQADISFAQPGTYDYAFRFSGDGGGSWVYCDLDDLLQGGYTPDQAGDAFVE